MVKHKKSTGVLFFLSQSGSCYMLIVGEKKKRLTFSSGVKKTVSQLYLLIATVYWCSLPFMLICWENDNKTNLESFLLKE